MLVCAYGEESVDHRCRVALAQMVRSLLCDQKSVSPGLYDVYDANVSVVV